MSMSSFFSLLINCIPIIIYDFLSKMLWHQHDKNGLHFCDAADRKTAMPIAAIFQGIETIVKFNAPVPRSAGAPATDFWEANRSALSLAETTPNKEPGPCSFFSAPGPRPRLT
ncbi:hypothetical protein [Azospirillum argentinense]